jgi:hypothetical protein
VNVRTPSNARIGWADRFAAFALLGNVVRRFADDGEARRASLAAR